MDDMTEKKQDQAKVEQQPQTQAIELEDARLEQAQGGAIDMKVDGVDGGGTKGIRDGTSN
jgi:hypothetical protein